MPSRREVERLCGEGHGIVAACRRLGFSDESLRKWKAHAAPPPAIYVPSTATLTLLAPLG